MKIRKFRKGIALLAGITLAASVHCGSAEGFPEDKGSNPENGGTAMNEAYTFPEPQDLVPIRELPDPLVFLNGEKVETAEQWQERRQEILALYEKYVYGKLPDRREETVSWTLEDTGTENSRKKQMTVTVRRNGREASFPVKITLPEAVTAASACWIEYCPFSWFGKPMESPNAKIAAERGYAAIQYDPTAVASDNDRHQGAYYDLYPFHENTDRQDGVLLNWAWGAIKILDALENGAARELGIDPGQCIVAGVSRYGKSAAVAGAYDERFRVTVPSCSGAGGIAIFRTDNHGKEYDLSSLKGPEAWINDSINEPFDNLKGGEGYWFCQNFRRIKSAEYLPVDQHLLCALAAGKNRHLLIVTGITSEGWNNTEGQCLAFVASQPVWELLGAGDQNNLLIHRDGHAILPEDMQKILDYCDVHLRGKPRESVRLSEMKGNLFLDSNRDRLGEEFDRYETEIRTVLSYDRRE